VQARNGDWQLLRKAVRRWDGSNSARRMGKTWTCPPVGGGFLNSPTGSAFRPGTPLWRLSEARNACLYPLFDWPAPKSLSAHLAWAQ
jgi:hypothetical protein